MKLLEDGSILLRKEGKKCIFMFSLFKNDVKFVTQNVIKIEHFVHSVCLYESVGLATTNVVDLKLTTT